jgi:hypothetical protein
MNNVSFLEYRKIAHQKWENFLLEMEADIATLFLIKELNVWIK